ncbi:hypothetical protein GD627_11810 [Arthrobacter yangruifuii]|uniref:Uncharacterized protein n=1 Tax=Arthrobacter yangruifuii TaxID=2606616 RepID=A0A5N6MF01_9MICC|nr:hypothetical protein [Arthrobacter yangruifuii]KAD3514991.1 hypothetical protein GD627_11810 [Arthrobacter yangruifuii]
MTQQEKLSTPPVPVRSQRHKILTMVVAALTVLLVVPGALNGGLFTVVFIFLMVPAFCLIRAYKVRSGRRWLIISCALVLGQAATAVSGVSNQGATAWMLILLTVYSGLWIYWGEEERRFSSTKRWQAAENVAAMNGTDVWFVNQASPSGSETRVVLYTAGRDPWSTAVWGTVRPGMLVVLNPAREILYTTWS